MDEEIPPLPTPDTGPDEAAAARETAALRTARQTGRRTPDEFLAPAQISSDADYEALKPGAKFVAPDGTTRKKPWTVASDEDYEAVPEGESFVDPEGATRQKPKFEGVNFTTQTLHNMAVNDKERLNALNRGYPGKVRQSESGAHYIEDEGGILRKPKPLMDQSLGSVLASQAAPVVGSVAGEMLGAAGGGVVGGPPGVIAGAVGGGAAGAAAGQTFNDMVLQLAGVYDRTGSEQLKETGIAAGLGGLGTAAGRGVAAAWPAVKGYWNNALPRVGAKFLGADEAGLATAIALREKGVDLVPPSGWAKESPHLQNLVEVFDPAFRTQKPLLQSATAHYEEAGGQILEKTGARPTGSLVDPAAAPSTREAGEALLRHRTAASESADKVLAEELDLARLKATLSILDPAGSTALSSAANNARRAAQDLIDAGFQDIQRDIDGAMVAAKAGHNSGELWWNVGEKLKAEKQGITLRARKMYNEADALAGENLPNITGLPQIADDFLRQLPEGFEKQHPAIIAKIRDLAGVEKLDKAGNPTGEWLKEPVNPTFGQLHELRSILRANFNYFDLTPSIKEGSFKFFANKVDAILNDANAAPALKAAARALKDADTFYRENMGPLTDKHIQAVMNGLESGLPADPKQLYNTLIKENRSDLTEKVKKLIGPNLWAGVKAADTQEMLDLSKTLTPGEIDGKAFVRQILDRVRTGMLPAVYGPEAAKLLKQAQYVQMFEGRVPIKAAPGDTVADTIAKAQTAAETAKQAAAVDPLGTLAKDMERIRAEHGRTLATARQDDPLGFIYDPTVGATEAVNKILSKEDLIIAAGSRFGENSSEFDLLRQVWAQRLLQGTLDPGKKLASVSPEVQGIMFPGVRLEEMHALAQEMDFLMSTRGVQETAKSMAAQAKVEHPWSSVAFGLKIKIPLGGDAAGRSLLGSYYKLVTTLSNNLTFMRWVMKGLKGDPAAREMTRQAVERAMNRGGAVGAAGGGSLAQANNFIDETPDESALPHRAEGGRVSGPTVVGEGGKEIFVPDQPGTIIPNEETEKILARSAIQPSVYDRFVNALHGIREATDPMNVLGSGSTGELGHDALSALQVATFGLKPSVRLTPTTNTTRLQLDGRFARQPVNPMASRGFRNWPAVGGAQAGAQALGGGEEAPAGGKGASGIEAAPSAPGADFNERWGTLAPPAASPQAPQPLFMQSGEMNVPLSELTVPLPRPKPAEGKSGAARPKPKAAAAPPNILEQLASALRGIDLSQLVQPIRQGRNTAANGHYEDGGQPPVGEPATVGEAGPELFVPDEPYREMRSLKSPARTQPPVAEGMSTADVSAALHKILFGDPSGSVPMQVDETGMPLALKSVGELREENPGVTHPAVELGAQIGLGQAGGAAATTMAKPVAQALQTAVKSAPYSTAGAGGALGAAVSGSEAGVETDRPAESFEVALPEPNPELLKRREAIEKKMDEAEAAFQTRSAKQYPTAKARDLDAQAHKDKMVGFRQDIKETNEEISQDQTKRKSEKQSEIKAVADLQKAKEERERPLMDRYPSLMALPYLGGAFSAGTAYVNRARQVEQYNTWATRVGDQIKKVATQIEKIDGKAAKSKKPSAETLQMEKDVLRSYANEAPEMQALINPGFLRSIAEKGGPAAGGATLAAELAMVPYQIDYATQQPDTAAGKEARKRLLTLDGWIKTAVSSLAGVTGATAGSTVPTRTKALLPDVKRAEVMSAAAPATATSAAARTNGGISPSSPALTAEVASAKQIDPTTLLRKSQQNKEMLKLLPGGQ